MDLQDIYETLAPQSIHIEQGDVIDEYEAAMTMLTEHFNPTRAAGNPRQRGKENREIPRDKTSPVHPQETEAEIMSDSDELKSYTKNNEPEEANISKSENRVNPNPTSPKARTVNPNPTSPKARTVSPNPKSPTAGTISNQKSPKARTIPNPTSLTGRTIPSPKSATARTIPNLKSPKARTVPNPKSPKARTIPNQKSPTARTIPNQKSPTARTIPNQKSPKARTIPNPKSPKARTIPNQKSPTARTIPNPKSPTARTIPNQKSPKARTIPNPTSLTARTIPNPPKSLTARTSPERAAPSKDSHADKPVEIHTSFAIKQTEESERQVFDDDDDENCVEFRNSNCQRRRLNDHVEIHAPITPSPAMTQSEKSLKSDPQDNGQLSDETVNVSINEHVDSNELNSNSCLDVIATRNQYRKVYTDIKRDTWIPLPKSVTNMWWTKLWSCKTIVTNSFPDSTPDRIPRDPDTVPTPSAPRWSSRHTRPPPRPPERLQCDVENFFPLDVRLSLGRNR